MTADTLFDDLVEQYLGEPLPSELAGAVAMSGMPPEAQGFIRRMLALMRRSAYPPNDFNSSLLRWLSTIPAMLPGNWGGKIPPITLPGRHQKLDSYVSAQPFPSGETPPVLVDAGCGFPPVTTAETARFLPHWRILGVDPAFAEYVLYDADGHYACFDRNGGFQYFQALATGSGRALYADPAAARSRFEGFFETLFPLLRKSGGSRLESSEMDGHQLIHHPIRDFETDNLSFIQSELTDLKIEAAKVIRCMNLLLYFDSENRNRMLRHAGTLLEENGILIVGTNGMGIQTRYAVFKRIAGRLTRVEFAFTLDNLGPIVFMPWFTIHDADPEAGFLAQLAGAVRAQTPFWTEFRSRVDELLQFHEICRRNKDGYLIFLEEMSPPAYLGKNAALWQEMEADGYVDGVVDVLRQAGYDSWKNTVGDVAVRPPEDFLICSR